MQSGIKEQWVKALVSGKYQQGTGMLAGPGKKGTAYCCLGVLCDLAVKADVIKAFPGAYNGSICYGFTGEDTEASILPEAVAIWAGLGQLNPDILLLDGETTTLADLNDKHMYDFLRIADVIEAQL